jgi:hypothetical protein
MAAPNTNPEEHRHHHRLPGGNTQPNPPRANTANAHRARAPRSQPPTTQSPRHVRRTSHSTPRHGRAGASE